MDIVAATRARLLDDVDFAALIGDDVGTGHGFGDWIFAETDSLGLPPPEIDGSGTSAVVITAGRSSVTTNTSMRMRTLTIFVFSDNSQDADGFTVRDNRQRCERVADEIIGALCQPADRGAQWGDTYVIGCDLIGDLSMVDVPLTKNAVRGELQFSVAVA